MSDVNDRPAVLLTRHDLLSILTGTKMGCSLTPAGASPSAGQQQVWVRLFTVDEFMEANRSANEFYAAQGVPSQPPPARSMVEDLVRPVPEEMVFGRGTT